jgi:hypothetical protein
LVDKGYIGINKIFSNIEMSKKSSKYKPLTPSDKLLNKQKSKRRISIEHLFCHLKKFSILKNKFRFRFNAFIIKFNLIAGFYNFEKSF